MSPSRPHRLLCVWTPVRLASYPVTPASSRFSSCHYDSESPCASPSLRPALACVRVLCAAPWPSWSLRTRGRCCDSLSLVIGERLFLSFSVLLFHTETHHVDIILATLTFEPFVLSPMCPVEPSTHVWQNFFFGKVLMLSGWREDIKATQPLSGFFLLMSHQNITSGSLLTNVHELLRCHLSCSFANKLILV